MTVLYDLLDDPIFAVEVRGERRAINLVDVLTTLARGEELQFDHLQPQQEAPWFVFLVQLAAIVCDRKGLPISSIDAGSVRETLRAIGGGREAFCLVVDDLAQPAFMQPPVPEGSIAGFDGPSRSPSYFDVLITTRLHDLKSVRVGEPEPDHWVYAMVTLQTFEGYSGRSNYGVVRMNGALSNRPVISRAPSTGFAARFVHDVAALRAGRDAVVATHRYRASGGHALIWTVPWDGKSALGLPECDPYFIEICRRLRLVARDGQLLAFRKPTPSSRIESGETQGNVGDPWVPISRLTGKALTVSANGFDYRLLCRLLLSGEFQRPAALMHPTGSTGVDWFVARTLVRGKGKTEGIHERVMPIPGEVSKLLFADSPDALLGQRAEVWTKLVGDVQNRVLKPSLCVFIQGAPDRLMLDDDRVQPSIAEHDAFVDRVFFELLFESLELDDEDANVVFVGRLVDEARRIRDRTFEALPTPMARRYRAIASAERTFEGAARKQFPFLFQKKPAVAAEEVNP